MQDQMYFTLNSNRVDLICGYQRLSGEEWLRGSDRVDALLLNISKMLNSNEQFEMDDSFRLSFVHVRSGPQGSGRKRKMKPGHSNPETFKRIKTSVITIQNEDDLCQGYRDRQGQSGWTSQLVWLPKRNEDPK